jgi:hypothetical protein
MIKQLRERIEKIGLHEMKKLLHSKGNSHQTEAAAHRKGESLCQLYTNKELIIKIYRELKN